MIKLTKSTELTLKRYVNKLKFKIQMKGGKTNGKNRKDRKDRKKQINLWVGLRIYLIT